MNSQKYLTHFSKPFLRNPVLDALTPYYTDFCRKNEKPSKCHQTAGALQDANRRNGSC